MNQYSILIESKRNLVMSLCTRNVQQKK